MGKPASFCPFFPTTSHLIPTCDLQGITMDTDVASTPQSGS
ncbi:hypothetical protein HMPREF9056_02420 [Actinomyces sp. oral taxon 170 str. F0386]|nr:hypothetical protein HMPREF9056_02420 [Actinomyces sp. oral taxon 170 str. F0386]